MAINAAAPNQPHLHTHRYLPLAPRAAFVRMVSINAKWCNAALGPSETHNIHTHAEEMEVTNLARDVHLCVLRLVVIVGHDCVAMPTEQTRGIRGWGLSVQERLPVEILQEASAQATASHVLATWHPSLRAADPDWIHHFDIIFPLRCPLGHGVRRCPKGVP